MRHDSVELLRSEVSKSSVWRLGDVLNELLDLYGLSEPSSASITTSAVCSDPGLFSTADLPATAAAAY